MGRLGAGFVFAFSGWQGWIFMASYRRLDELLRGLVWARARRNRLYICPISTIGPIFIWHRRAKQWLACPCHLSSLPTTRSHERNVWIFEPCGLNSVSGGRGGDALNAGHCIRTGCWNYTWHPNALVMMVMASSDDGVEEMVESKITLIRIRCWSCICVGRPSAVEHPQTSLPPCHHQQPPLPLSHFLSLFLCLTPPAHPHAREHIPVHSAEGRTTATPPLPVTSPVLYRFKWYVPHITVLIASRHRQTKNER